MFSERKKTQGLIEMPEEVHNQIVQIIKPLLEDWSSQKLSSDESDVLVYGIRRYFKGAWLALHVDEFPRVISAIIQVSSTLFTISISVVSLHFIVPD